MLYLTRKVGESVIINDSIELTIVEVKGKTVKIGFSFPPSATVLRKEVYDRIRTENQAALGDGASFFAEYLARKEDRDESDG